MILLKYLLYFFLLYQQEAILQANLLNAIQNDQRYQDLLAKAMTNNNVMMTQPNVMSRGAEAERYQQELLKQQAQNEMMQQAQNEMLARLQAQQLQNAREFDYGIFICSF